MALLRKPAFLWTLAFVLTLASAAWQRLTGPTWPQRGSFAAGGESHRFKLPRSATTDSDKAVSVPDPGPQFSGTLRWKRFKTADAFVEIPLARKDGKLAAALPVQPAAGKLMYHLVVAGDGAEVRIPADPREDPVIRFRGSVPAAIMVPHVVFMFLAVLFGICAALKALLHPDGLLRTAWLAFGSMTVGGMILGPLVQKAAFDEYWTGFPYGHDLTDNKTLIMWLLWLAAVLLLRFLPEPRAGLRRGVTLAAAVVMIVVYLVPHSAYGSELDWSAAPPPNSSAPK